jgi:thymidylate kinase
MKKEKGILVTIMGITNVGKTTQMEILERLMVKKGLKFKTLKYPIYDLVPTGPRIHSFLKGGNPENLTPKDFQELCAQNRKDFEPQLIQLLANNDIVVAEMYTGTGIAYGVGDGVPKDHLLKINYGILLPDVSVLLDGDRFLESREKVHRYENDDEITEKIRKIHLGLAKDFDWKIVNANQSVEEVHKQIWQEISLFL